MGPSCSKRPNQAKFADSEDGAERQIERSLEWCEHWLAVSVRKRLGWQNSPSNALREKLVVRSVSTTDASNEQAPVRERPYMDATTNSAGRSPIVTGDPYARNDRQIEGTVRILNLG